MDNDMKKINFGELPVEEAEFHNGKAEDVEFAEELADDADRAAMKRAAEADRRNET
ncbi:YfhD family protein [Paenibacillus sp. PL2-23]|uniref:YfhD family protein n=1 Tax=Paenibacillus sp. PL2-23 TaxID=2100729 RepID=UPI0030F727B8